MAPRPKYWVLYTTKPPILRITPSTPNSCPITHRPWWTIPETERVKMNAFTRPSQQLRVKVRHALLRNLHHTSQYRRTIVANKEMGARLHTVGHSIHKQLNSGPKEGITLLKFMYGQLYNCKLAKRYWHASTSECPLCNKPNSCTHIAGECKDHKALRISRHNAAYKLVHAAIRKASKGVGVLHTAKKERKWLQHPLIGAQRETCTRGCAFGPAILGKNVPKPFVGQILLSRTIGLPMVASLPNFRTRK